MNEPLVADPLLIRLTRIEERLDRLVAVLDDALPTIGMATDAADEVIAGLQERGVDLDERVQGVGKLLDQLSDPSTVAVLSNLVESLPRLAPLIDVAATFEGTTGMVFDMFDAQVAELQAQGIDPEARFGQVAELLIRLTDPEFHQHLSYLLDAAPALMAATRTGEVFGRAIDEVACCGAPQQVGVLGVLRALSDPNVQRAAGFAVQVAQKVGEHLPEHMAGLAPAHPQIPETLSR